MTTALSLPPLLSTVSLCRTCRRRGADGTQWRQSPAVQSSGNKRDSGDRWANCGAVFVEWRTRSETTSANQREISTISQIIPRTSALLYGPNRRSGSSGCPPRPKPCARLLVCSVGALRLVQVHCTTETSNRATVRNSVIRNQRREGRLQETRLSLPRQTG